MLNHNLEQSDVDGIKAIIKLGLIVVASFMTLMSILAAAAVIGVFGMSGDIEALKTNTEDMSQRIQRIERSIDREGDIKIRGFRLAHGDAQWIMDNWASQNTRWCCGPRDCRALADGAIEQPSAGVYIAPDGRAFYEGLPGLYWSKDDHFWLCTREEDGERRSKCLFRPSLGS